MECQLENTTLHYEMLGEGRPLVVLHGAAGDHRAAAAEIEPLFTQRAGWKRIYPDLPGHGATRPSLDAQRRSTGRPPAQLR